jgi:hypothetical protein
MTTIRILRLRFGANTVRAIKYVRSIQGRGLAVAKRVVDDALDGKPATFEIPERMSPKVVIERLDEFGVDADVDRQD